MPYDETNWQDGDVITAERLNKMETGIANATAEAESQTIHVVGTALVITTE